MVIGGAHIPDVLPIVLCFWVLKVMGCEESALVGDLVVEEERLC